MIRIGPAGWSYADWRGRIHAATGGDELAGLLDVFACVEVNVSFYRDPPAAMQTSWLERVARHPHARLPLKLHRRFTHDVPRDVTGDVTGAAFERALENELAEWRTALAPWLASERRGPLLVQFPFSFAPGRRERRHLDALLERLASIAPATSRPLEIAVELRRREWFEPQVHDALLAHGNGRQVALATLDLPHHPRHPDAPPTPEGPFGYLRFHGRNARAWFDPRATRDERYDYLYAPEEIERLADLVRGAAARVDEVFVITNNHFEGKAVANAVELLAALGMPPARIPARWAEHFPHLARLAPLAGQRRLF